MRDYRITHVQEHGEDNIDNHLTALLKRFLGSMNESSLAYQKWHKTIITFSSRFEYYHFPLYKIRTQLIPSSLSSLAITAFGFHKIILDWWIVGFDNINQKNNQGESLLQLGVEGGFTSIVQDLIAKGADVNAISGRSNNALNVAAGRGHETIVQLLLNAGADINAVGEYDKTALQAAVWGGHETVVRRLLEEGADVNADERRAAEPEWQRAVVLLEVLLVAYYCGGYVAGRMARINGLKQGDAVWVWAVVIAVLVGVAGAVLGSEFDVLDRVGGFPRLPIGGGDVTTGGIVAGLIALVAALVGAILGGLAGMRFHRKVDKAGLGH